MSLDGQATAQRPDVVQVARSAVHDTARVATLPVEEPAVTVWGFGWVAQPTVCTSLLLQCRRSSMRFTRTSDSGRMITVLWRVGRAKREAGGSQAHQGSWPADLAAFAEVISLTRPAGLIFSGQTDK